ncbi:MAG: hypothetical protein M3R27_05615 [Bacteroidota bacterium]|nr:hypothetical protein [Bacteroidota bacterium]
MSFTSRKTIDERSKEKISKDFKENYLGSEIKDIEWSGNKFLCKKGKLKEETYTKILQRINYFRRTAGVNDSIELDDSYNNIAQAAAFIMYCNDRLTHEPSKDLKCYSEEGYDGASTSNLSLLIKGEFSRLITDQMEDDGSGNEECGHRSWILFPERKKMGFGATISSYALQVINGTKNKRQIPSYYSWPSCGFVPFQIVFKRWSFVIPNGNVDFSKAKVEMLVEGSIVKCSLTHKLKQGDDCIVWQVQGLQNDFNYSYYSMDTKKKAFQKLNLMDKKITVKIYNDKQNNEVKDYKYDVYIFDPMEVN